MQTKHLCVLIHSWTKDEVGAPWNWIKPSSKIVFLTVPRRCFFCGSFMLFLSCFCYARLLIDALWSPAGKGLTSWLLFVMSNCEDVTFPFVSWVRCGAWLYRFLIFALFLTFLTYRPIIEPWYEIFNNVVCATSKASDQPAHTRSLIRAFASRLHILRVLSYWLNIILSF